MSSKVDMPAVVIAAIFAGIGLYVFVSAEAFTSLGAIFPKFVAILLMALSLLAAFVGITRRDHLRPTRNFPIRPVLVAAVMILWIAVLPRMGFVLSGILAFLAISVVIPGTTASRPRTLVQTLIASIVIVSSFYFLLRYGLNIPLPRGILGL
jgi:hypothetical protein